MTGSHFLWAWLLKYASFLATAALSFFTAWYVDRFVTRRAKLIFYTSHIIRVAAPPPPAGQPWPEPIATFSLFLWNQGKAPAREVHVGHFASPLPNCNVYPDIPRDIVNTPGGGTAIRFSVLPPQTLITISYLIFGQLGVENVISYVGSEEGLAQRIPVILQRIYPPWVIRGLSLLMIVGAWVVFNAALSLIHYLWVTFYR